jgi:phosphatidylinositol alpha-1,6-mannosyltransferase
MRILLMTDSFLPHAGGSRVYYHNIYKSWVQQFPDQVTILTKKVGDWKEFDRREASKSLEIIRRFHPLPNLKAYQLPKIIFPALDALRIWRWQQPDMIHAGDLYPPGVIALALKRWLGLPYLIYCHGEEITQTERYRYQPRVRNVIYKEANVVVAACEFARNHLVRLGIPEGRICKITPGVDYEEFAPRSPDPELLDRFSLRGKKVLLTVSRLWPRKGHEAVMRAMVRILPEVPDVQYLIVGKGPEEGKLRQLASELGLTDQIVFVGFVPQEKLSDFYNLCDVFVMANREEEESGDMEGFGMVFLEANAAGKPVIGGRSGGTSDSVLDGVTGLLVNPESVDEIAGALKRLLTDPALRRKLGEAGLARARREFGWKEKARTLRQVSQGAARGDARETAPTVSVASANSA